MFAYQKYILNKYLDIQLSQKIICSDERLIEIILGY